MSKRRFAIGDIHGCSKTFRRLLEVITLEKDDVLFLVGDLIDRGPDSKGVIDTVLSLVENGFDIRCCLGNHEDMMLLAVHKGVFEDLLEWLENGGVTTLKSYGVNHPQEIPERHLCYLESLPLYHITKGFVVVHAGIDCTLEDPFSEVGGEHMLWDRGGRVDIGRLGGRRVVSGHSVRTLEEIRRSLGKKHLRIDNGCVYGPRCPGKGNLVAVDLDTLEQFIQKNIDEDSKAE